MNKEDLEYIQYKFEQLKRAEQIKEKIQQYYNKIKNTDDEELKEIIHIAYDLADNHVVNKQTVVDNICIDY